MDFREFLPDGVKPTTVLRLSDRNKSRLIQLGLFDGGVFFIQQTPEYETFAAGKVFSDVTCTKHSVMLQTWIVLAICVVVGGILMGFSLLQLYTTPSYIFLLVISLLLLVTGGANLVRKLFLVSLVTFSSSIGHVKVSWTSRNPAMYDKIKEFIQSALSK